MVKSVQLRKEDCYCDLTEFYENVARKIPAEITDSTAGKFVSRNQSKKLYGHIIVMKKERPMSRLLRCC